MSGNDESPQSYAVDERDPGFTLRGMTPEDLPVVHGLELRLFPEDAWPLDMFEAELMQRDTREYFVATIGGTVVAYAGLMCIPPIADVQTIAVIPEFEGRGIGSTLLRTLLQRAAHGKAEDMLLEVREDNPRAQELYRRFGFEQIAVRKNYYKGGINALIMRRELSPEAGQSAGQDNGGKP